MRVTMRVIFRCGDDSATTCPWLAAPHQAFSCVTIAASLCIPNRTGDVADCHIAFQRQECGKDEGADRQRNGPGQHPQRTILNFENTSQSATTHRDRIMSTTDLLACWRGSAASTAMGDHDENVQL